MKNHLLVKAELAVSVEMLRVVNKMLQKAVVPGGISGMPRIANAMRQKTGNSAIKTGTSAPSAVVPGQTTALFGAGRVQSGAKSPTAVNPTQTTSIGSLGVSPNPSTSTTSPAPSASSGSARISDSDLEGPPPSAEDINRADVRRQKAKRKALMQKYAVPRAIIKNTFDQIRTGVEGLSAAQRQERPIGQEGSSLQASPLGPAPIER